ncbi:MAG: nuclear transport factor 2 family protein [Chloroflexota bacterium]|nr:nuclear transport factor 2 family protein [Chloroflexota bacterium]
MEASLSSAQIRKVAMGLDNALEARDTELVLTYFSDDCEIELLGVKLVGKEGARRWLDWLYGHLNTVKLLPITIMVEGDTFFEEFVLKGRLQDGHEVESKQAEVLVYENYKVKSLRLYFDRLDFADAVAKGFISKAIVSQMIKASLKDLT